MLRLIPTANDTDARDEVRFLHRGDHVELADALVEQLASTTDAVYTDGDIYRYDPTRGLWLAVRPDEASRMLMQLAGVPVGESGKSLKMRSSDVAGAIKLACDRLTQERFFSGAADGLAFANGFATVTADGVALRPHAPEHRARTAYDFDYDGSATSATFDRMLDMAFGADPDGDAKAAALQEMTGACLLGIATRYQTAFFLFGPGGEGKSAMLDVLRGAMPPGSVTAIPPAQFASEYTRAQLAGVRMNVVAELPEARILDATAFKALVTGDLINARHIYRRPFTFVPTAGHIFAANGLPDAKDLSHGFWRRILVIAFLNRVPEAERDRDIARRVLERERPGVVRWALDGAVRLLARGAYAVPASSITMLEQWRRDANPIAEFVAQRTRRETDEALWTPAQRLYCAYRSWCDQTGHSAENQTLFGRKVGQLLDGGKHTSTGKRYPVALHDPEPRR